MDFYVKFYIFKKVTHSLIIASNHKSPFDFICLDLRCTIKEVNAIFVHLIIDKSNKKPTYYINIDRPILKTFKLVVKYLGIIIMFDKDLPQP